jgi:hypothetical protein
MDVGGNNGVSSLGQATFTALRIQASGHDTRGDVTKVFSRHTVKAGVEYRKMFMNFTQHGQPSGQYNFNNAWTQRQVGAANSTTQGAGFASYLLGMLGGGQLSHTFAIASESPYWGFYVQDDWKVSQKLTLNVGLRWMWMSRGLSVTTGSATGTSMLHRPSLEEFPAFPICAAPCVS